MATKTRIYVPRIEHAKIESGALFANSGYGYEMLGYNPNTYALLLASSVALRIKLEADDSATSVIWGTDAINFAGIYMRYPYDMVAGNSTVVIASTPYSNYTSLTTRSTVNCNQNTEDQPLAFATFATTTDKYWQLTINRSSAANCQIAMVFIGTYFDLTRSPDFNDTDESGFDVQQTDLGMGRVLSRLGISSARRVFLRSYNKMTDAELAILRKAHTAAYGPHAPIVLVDARDSASFDAKNGRLMRFMNPRISPRRIIALADGTRWDVDVGFEELAQLPFGRSY